VDGGDDKAVGDLVEVFCKLIKGGLEVGVLAEGFGGKLAEADGFDGVEAEVAPGDPGDAIDVGLCGRAAKDEADAAMGFCAAEAEEVVHD